MYLKKNTNVNNDQYYMFFLITWERGRTPYGVWAYK